MAVVSSRASPGAQNGSYGLSRSLSERLRTEPGNTYPSHQTYTLDALRGSISQNVQALKKSEILLICFAGYPGVGKSGKTEQFVNAAASGFSGNYLPHSLYRNPQGKIISEPVGKVFAKGGVTSVGTDLGFKGVGPVRRGPMLQNEEMFLRYWGDRKKIARIFWNIAFGEPIWDSVYTGTAEEKLAQKPLGRIQTLNYLNPERKNIMLLEGVNAIEVLPEIIKSTREGVTLKVMKVLFDVSLLDSTIRLSRRERDNKKHPDGTPYTIAEILENRLIEQDFITHGFIEPAFRDPEVILLNKPREMPPFTGEERDEILDFLYKFLLKDEHANDPKKAKFIYGLIARLEDYFYKLDGVSREEYAIWKKSKDEKKLRAQGSS